MGFLGSLFGGSSYEPEMGASQAQAQQLYKQQQDRLLQQQRFAEALQAQSPQAIEQQIMLGKELAGAIKGQGPSVAQAQLAESTAQNIARQQAMLSGQRGASANVGLMGRTAADVGSQIQQEAARQAATLRAQEQIAARQQLGSLTGQQLDQISGAQALGIQGVTGAQQNVLRAIEAQNQTRAEAAKRSGGILGGVLGAAGTILGGPIGGALASSLFGGGGGSSGPKGSNISDYTSLAQGGEVKAMLSPGEKYLPPSEVKKVASGQKNPMAAGKTIPGKAKVSGDSFKNDVVPATLQEGGIVIPRSVTQAEDASEKARQFVAAVLAKKQLKR